MEKALQQFSGLDINQLAAELGGILFTPSIFINCLISSRNRSSLYGDAVLSILGRSTDFLLKGYIIEIDKHIVMDNLRNAKRGGYITPERAGIVEGALHSLTALPCNPEIEIEAHCNSNKMSLYDARRMETAFQHDLTVLSCEPGQFTQCPDELNHLFRYEYADIAIGPSINLDEPEAKTRAKVWVFKPEALDTLLCRFDPNARICEANRDTILSLKDYQLTSNRGSSHASVQLLFKDQLLAGQSQQIGPIDAVIRAIETALKDIITVNGDNIHHRVSDTAAKHDKVRVSIRIHVPEHYFPQWISPSKKFEAVHESRNTVLSTAVAYVKVLNTILKEIDNGSMNNPHGPRLNFRA